MGGWLGRWVDGCVRWYVGEGFRACGRRPRYVVVRYGEHTRSRSVQIEFEIGATWQLVLEAAEIHLAQYS